MQYVLTASANLQEAKAHQLVQRLRKLRKRQVQTGLQRLLDLSADLRVLQPTHIEPEQSCLCTHERLVDVKDLPRNTQRERPPTAHTDPNISLHRCHLHITDRPDRPGSFDSDVGPTGEKRKIPLLPGILPHHLHQTSKTAMATTGIL
jgi:hypothetical protein